MGGGLNEMNTFRGTTIGTRANNIEAQFQSTDQNIVDTLYSQRDSYRLVHATYASFLQSLSQNTMIQMANDDTLLSQKTLFIALQLLISQMKSGAQSIKKPTVSGAASAVTGTGNGVGRVTVLGSDGLQQDYIFNEAITALCTLDSIGGATAGNEQFTITSPAAQNTQLSWDWPGGSGTSAIITVVNGETAVNNVTPNPGWEAGFTSNVPNSWVALVGTGGATIFDGTAAAYKGSHVLQFTGTGAELTSVASTFTTGVIARSTIYGVNWWDKVSAVPAAGVLEISLVDGSNTVINDDNGVANLITVNLPGETTSYAAHGGFFRTPTALPSTVKIRVRLSTALDNTKSVYIDTLALTPLVPQYPGGPCVVVYAGSTNFLKNDLITFTISNAYDSGWAKLAQRFWGLNSLGLKLPSSGSPTINDSLIL
jgi:hypothetical protein